MQVTLRPLTPSTATVIEQGAAESLFWPLAKLASRSPKDEYPEDACFDKELWLQRILLEWGTCGYTAFVETGTEGCLSYPAATIIFAPSSYMLGAELFPTAPLSHDAVLLSTVHVALPYAGLYLEHQLISALFHEAQRRGIKAIEAFAKKPQKGDNDDGDFLWEAPILSSDILLDNGFKIIHDHPVYPRLRYEIPDVKTVFAAASEDHSQGQEVLPTVLGGGRMKRKSNSFPFIGPRVPVGTTHQSPPL